MDLNLNLFSTKEKFDKGLLRNIISMLSVHQVGIWEYDIESNQLRFVNDFFRILGLDRIGVKCSTLEELYEYIYPDDLPVFNKAFSSVSAVAGSHASVKYRLIGAEEKIMWLEDHFFSSADSKGKPEKVMAYTVNVDFQQEQGDKILKLEDKYRKLVNTLPDFIFVFNRDFVFIDVIMPDAMTLLHSREELIGSDARNIFSKEVSDLYVSNIRECLDTGQMKEIEYYLNIGEIRYYFQARIVPFEGDKVFALIHDIGDRIKRMEELLAARRQAEDADRMKTAFLANMSHEIRTPLNAIVGFTEIIAEEEDVEARAQYMDIVRVNNNLLLQLINDILDLARIESGKCEMHFEDTDINMLVQEVEKTYQFKMKPEVEFNIELPSGEICVFTDHSRVTQVLFNLLSNAVKNTESGSITLKVEIEGSFLKFSVIDTGYGIPENKLKTIFNRFEKLNDFVQGTGLGLAICETLVGRLGGEIKVESELGKGSTFSFTVPYRNITHNLLRQQGMKVHSAKQTISQRKKILVAEASEASFSFIKDTLEKSYDILWVVNGEEAINSFILESPDLILMNIQLPVINGIDATRKIRSISYSVPIIGITANAFYMDQQWALESGCNDIISKPYSATKLEEIVLAFI